jgi:hypothetical protein
MDLLESYLMLTVREVRYSEEDTAYHVGDKVDYGIGESSYGDGVPTVSWAASL